MHPKDEEKIVKWLKHLISRDRQLSTMEKEVLNLRREIEEMKKKDHMLAKSVLKIHKDSQKK